MGVPVAPVVTERFSDLVKSVAYKKGQPHQRITFVPHPVSGRSAEEGREYLEGNDPLTDQPVVEELITALTSPLTEDEAKTGFIDPEMQDRLFEPDTEENLHRLFVANGWTDGLPIVLPTEERVAAMLEGTSHAADEVVGTMQPSSPHPAWSYTVEQVAVNAVMAGASPEHFPVILAIASTGVPSLFTSTTSFARMAVVNGPIRNEIGMNSGIGALGPLNEANAVIGRAWTLMSINLDQGALPGTTYMGSQGNNLNYNNLTFPEKEESLPEGWDPVHVQKGYEADESVVSLFSGHFMYVQSQFWPYPYEKLIKHAIESFTHYGPANSVQASVVMDPLVAQDIKAEGFETKEELSQWLRENCLQTPWEYWTIHPEHLEAAEAGTEPYASWLELPEGATIPVPRFREKSPPIDIVVVGGETNQFWQAGNFSYVVSASIDDWR